MPKSPYSSGSIGAIGWRAFQNSIVNRFAVGASPSALPSSGSIPWEGARRETAPRQAISVSGRTRRKRRWQQRQTEEKMIVEGAWVLVVAVVVFAATVTVVLVGSGKLYDFDRSHE
jgi:hypothetical protein